MFRGLTSGGHAIRSAARMFSSRTSWRCALTDASATEDFYSNDLDLKAASAVLLEDGFLWSAVVADAAKSGASADSYIDAVLDCASKFMDSSSLCGREATRAALRRALTGKGGRGNLALVLGSKSVGKTFLMRRLREQLHQEGWQFDEQQARWREEARKLLHGAQKSASEQESLALRARAHELKQQAACELRDKLPRRVAVHNGRSEGSDLAAGLVSAFRADPFFFERFKRAFAKVTSIPGACDHGTPVDVEPWDDGELIRWDSETEPHHLSVTVRIKTAAAAAEAALRNAASPPRLKHVVAAYGLACREERRFPCIVIEEAAAVFEGATPEQRERTAAAMRLFTQLTKEEQQLNVAVTSSDPFESFRFNTMGVKHDHWTKSVVVAELPPGEMRELLRGQWGMGEHLADAITSVWGGHVWGVYKGLELLADGREAVAAIHNPVIYSMTAIRGAADCVQAEREHPATMDGMTYVLLAAARDGNTCPFHNEWNRSLEEDPRIIMGIEGEVLSVVMRSAHAPHVPVQAFRRLGGCAAVVPASQSMRLLLAHQLLLEAKHDSEARVLLAEPGVEA